LTALDEAAVGQTALGSWLRGDAGRSGAAEDQPILELVPLNAEQRQAVVQGLTAPLTVVTGPPGTGKSQVVVALLANMAFQGRSVLFASKNNHAVDVVESRANELGTNPLLLRLGKEEHHARLAQNLAVSLAQSVSPEQAAGYAWLEAAHEQVRQRFAAVQTEIGSVVALRNRVDELERAAEPARAVFGQETFRALGSTDLDGIRERSGSLVSALEGVKKSEHAPMARLLQPRRSRQVAEALSGLRGDAELMKVKFPSEEDGPEAWANFHRALSARLDYATRAQAYWLGLEQLRQARPLENLAQDLMRIAEESSRSSLELWRRWIHLWPTRWTTEQRQILSEYVSLLQMIATGDRSDEGVGRKVFRRYYRLFPEVTKILPCWAVTSLSARGRLPFEGGIFDLVVIDEASQCDIASALPLLLRARRAVIIGDPLQLKHVSTVGPQQDRMILAAHGLEEGRAAWAYSVNSLFDLARSLCRYEDIVNLREHHRSHRDIIGFSNRHFYREGLRVATDHEGLRRARTTGPAVRWIDLRGKVVRPSRGGALNPVEAEAVVAELRKLVVEQEYSGSIGVVTPFRAQANRIRMLAHQNSELSGRLAALQFVVDTVHGFQGDERDVIIFSPVVSLGIGESTLRFLKNHANLFNVAITRARSDLIVIGDRQAALGSGVAYLAAFAEYTENVRSEDRTFTASPGLTGEYPIVARPEFVSEWERSFYRAMYQAGLRPVPQYEEAPYTLDFALFSSDRKLDIEVDGENYHRNWDGELCRRDQIRSRRLSDLGWDIMRFWVYELRDDPDGCLARVKGWLEARP
jgi:very-short-patch-repair endonuclease